VTFREKQEKNWAKFPFAAGNRSSFERKPGVFSGSDGPVVTQSLFLARWMSRPRAQTLPEQ
jgi:hypothetical protein